MPGHTRSIYSRRQRLGPARFDNPLADFLDRLPDYFNDYQRNQLALERQQLADKRYEDSKELARQQREEEQRRYDKEQKRLDKKAETDELNRIRSIGNSFLNNGDTEQAIKIFEKTGDMDIVSGLRDKAEKETGREDAFVEIRNMSGRSDTNPFQFKDKLEKFREDYNIRPGDNSNLDRQLFQIESLNNQQVNRRNKGMIPLEEWKTLDPEARADYNTVINSENNIKELREDQIKGKDAITSSLGGPSIKERIQFEQETISKIMNKPKYKLETEAEYRARIKVPVGAIIPTDQETFYADASLFPASPEIKEFEEQEINDMLDMANAPIETQADTVQRQSSTPIQDILNIPSAQAQPQTTEQDTTEPADLQLGETISAQPTSNFDVKDISEVKNNMLKNPQTARRLKKDIGKLKNLINEMSTLSQLKDERSRNFRKKQLDEGIEAISNKIKKQYGDFINPNTGEFSSEEFSNEFFSVLSMSSNTPQDQLKQLFKGFSTAKPVQQAI